MSIPPDAPLVRIVLDLDADDQEAIFKILDRFMEVAGDEGDDPDDEESENTHLLTAKRARIAEQIPGAPPAWI
ncbi:hypothetical protein [Nonomuraea sp. NPDC046570]|uniref:hypothetical protein n=1 Tax=Nonomuraea sp. NPDC046570 TaxID=3155255 RepID=UPI0033CE8FE6